MDDLLSIEQVSTILHVTPRTLLNYRRMAHGPAPTRVGFRRIFYRRSDVDAYLSAMREKAIDECIRSCEQREQGMTTDQASGLCSGVR